jgi:hypothetical protein
MPVGNLLAGGAGVEWYFGYRYPHTDLTCEDFRSRENWWKQSTTATSFVNSLPVERMKPANQLINISKGYCLANPGEIYVVYLPANSGELKLNLETDKKYSVSWFNPRMGGKPASGKVKTITGKGQVSLGTPPSDPEKDWVVLIK